MKRTKAPKEETLYRRLWRIVDGAVADTFAHHPDYLTQKGRHGNAARISLNKRIVGVCKSFTEESVRGRVRSQPDG